MFKKLFMFVLILTMLLFAGACGEAEEDPEGDDNGESAALEDDDDEAAFDPEEDEYEAQDDPVDQEEDENEEGEKEEDDSAELLDDIEAKWTAELDFEADQLEDWLLGSNEIHFLYELQEQIYYQAFDLNSGEKIEESLVEGIPELENQEQLGRSTAIRLHELDGEIFAIAALNQGMSHAELEPYGENHWETKLKVIDLKENIVVLSKTPEVESYKIPRGPIRSGTFDTGLIFDVTADGQHLMILHHFPMVAGWDNYRTYSLDHDREDLEEENHQVMSQTEDAPIWVFDLKEKELKEIPYDDEIAYLSPHGVEGFENGMNMIFTEQEGWLILDIEEETIEKTGEGGVYRRTEPGAPGVEEYRDGESIGQELLFTKVSENAEICGIPFYHYIWSTGNNRLQYRGTVPISYINQRFYYNHHTEEIIVNTSKGQEGQELIEKIYRLSFDEERLKDNQASEPVESLKELDGIEVVEKMEFPLSGEEASQGRLSTTGHGTSARPIKDFQHLGYGILSGVNLNQPSPSDGVFYYVNSNAAEEEVLKVGYGNLLLADSKQVLFFKENHMIAYDLDEFFGGLER